MIGTEIVAGTVAGQGSRSRSRPTPPGVETSPGPCVEPATGCRNRPVEASTAQVEASTVRQVTIAGVRGGQGTSTVASALALLAATYRPTRLVSCEPDVSAALLGVAFDDRPGDGSVVVGEGLELATGSAPFEDGRRLTVFDVGRLDRLPEPAEGVVRLLVVRGPVTSPLRSLTALGGAVADGIVLLCEPGRSLTARDVADVAGTPVVAQLDVTATIARVVDAGLLAARVQRLDELAPLRRWIAQHVAPTRSRTTARQLDSAAF